MYVEIDPNLNGEAYDWVQLELKILPEKIFATTPEPNDKNAKTFWWFDNEEDAMAFKLKWG